MVSIPTLLLLLFFSFHTCHTAFENGSCECQFTQQNPRLECPLPYTKVHGHCVLVETLQQGTWYEMRNFCHQIGGELVKVDSDNFMYYLVKYLKDNGLTNEYYWIGGSDEAEEGNWQWPDGTSVKLGTPFWGDDTDQNQEPDGGTSQNCLTMNKGDHYFFHDNPCQSNYAAICERLA